MSDGDAADLTELEPTRKRMPLRARSMVLGGVLIVVAGAAIFTYKQAKPVIDAKKKYSSITYQVPAAQKLTPASGETVYRIDPTKSSLTYQLHEQFAGKKTSSATGVTNGIAGDVAINAKDLAESHLGPVVANVFQFHSDNNLRDARLRQDYLESNKYPLATFKVTKISGLTGTLTDGKAYPLTLTGTATVKGKRQPVTFKATAKLADGTLTATATTKTKLSSFGVGPIRIAGMLSTSDDVTLTLKLTAFDPTKHTIPTTITGPHAKEAKDAPSFAKTVQPILEANCVSCHATGKMGAHTLTLDTAGDAQAVSDGLKTVTEVRHMPPWPASDKGVPLAHKMSLTQAQIDAIAKWSDAGGALDVPDGTLLKQTASPLGPVPRKDMVLDRPAYTGSLKNVNDYRCFVLDPKLTKPMYLTGYTFLSDQVDELHHAQVFHVSPSQVESSKKIDGKDGEPGWGCYGGPGLKGQKPPKVPGRGVHVDAGFSGQSSLVAGWVPGQGPSVFPMHSGILLEPGDALVLQLHYHYSATPTPDRSTIAIQLDPGTAPIKALRVINPLGPVEIPCAPADQKAPLCDRDAAIADDVRLYGPDGADNESGLMALCQQTPEALAARFDGTVAHTTCNLKVPEDGLIVSALGHMHTIGKSISMTLDPGTKKQKILLDIPDWSFDWQMNYELAKPIHVTAGEPLRLECSWDRSLEPLRKPKYIVFAEGTEDEMCFGTYAIIPDDQSAVG